MAALASSSDGSHLPLQLACAGAASARQASAAAQQMARVTGPNVTDLVLPTGTAAA